VGSLDNVVEQLIPVFVDDIFGTVAEEKDTEAIQNKHKEARKATSYSSFTIVARFTSPSRADELILNPLRDAMSTSSSSKITGKLREILRCAVIGFNSHGAEVADHMLHLAEGCVKGALPKSQQGNIVTKPGASATATSIYIVPPEKRKKGAEAYFNTNAHLLVEMGLGLLVHLCRQNKLDLGEDGRHSAELNAAVPTVVDCLHSKYNRVMVLALQFFTVVLPRCEGMPDVKGATNHVAKRVFKLIRRSGASSATVDLNRACFATAAVIVRHCPWFEMSEGHVRVLLSFVQADLEVDDKQKNAFQVLKSVLARKVLAVEVYDTVDMVLEILVRAASPAARKMARSAVLQFLLDYPLGKKRLDKTLNYLVSNLDFELDGGRESALLMLESVVVRFPDAILAEYVFLLLLLLFFLPHLNPSVFATRVCMWMCPRVRVSRCSAPHQPCAFEQVCRAVFPFRGKATCQRERAGVARGRLSVGRRACSAGDSGNARHHA
jgi:U3 small nucleolar RNA-associated protein 20